MAANRKWWHPCDNIINAGNNPVTAAGAAIVGRPKRRMNEIHSERKKS